MIRLGYRARKVASDDLTNQLIQKTTTEVVMEMKGLDLFLKRKEMFLERVIQKEGCWGWKGHITPKGYARFKANGVPIFGNIFSWMLYKGDIPYKYFVCHHCDNPICCNPEHLFISKPHGNSADMVNKNRQAKGNKHGMSTLTENEVRIIKKRLKNGESGYKISKDFPVNMSTIYNIQYGKTWKHLEEPCN